jgi:ribosome-associated protein
MEQLSKSELKRQHKQIESAAREIVRLNDNELKRLNLGGELIETVQLCRQLKGGALKRQIKYLAKLLKQEPLDDILGLLAFQKGSKLQENKLHHQAERLRDAIINEALAGRDESIRSGVMLEMDWPSEAIAEAVARYSDIDETELRRSAYQYVRTRNRVHSRELFRLLRAAAEKQRLHQGGS